MGSEALGWLPSVEGTVAELVQLPSDELVLFELFILVLEGIFEQLGLRGGCHLKFISFYFN